MKNIEKTEFRNRHCDGNDVGLVWSFNSKNFMPDFDSSVKYNIDLCLKCVYYKEL